MALLPSEPRAFKKHLKELSKIKAHFLFDPAFFIPNLSPAELAMGIQSADIIIGNDYEIALMEKKIHKRMSQWSDKRGDRGGVIIIRTLGPKGSEIYHGSWKYQIPAAKVKRVNDPTGAGDAYRAGFIAGYIWGEALETCGKMGATAAAYTVEKYGTQTHRFSLSQFQSRLKRAF